MSVRLKLICHAPTSANRTFAFPDDEPIDHAGRKKLTVAVDELRNADSYWTSPALRAVQTAKAWHLNATIEPMLCDCDYGRWRGRSLEDVRKQQPEAVDMWMTDPRSAPHGGESILDVVARVGRWLDNQNGTSGDIVAVTHASVIRAAVIHAIGAPPESFWRIDISSLSLTRLSGNNGRWNLVSLNLNLPGRSG